jgi:D-lyxose ketol-isomerase
MIDAKEFRRAQQKALKFFNKAGVVLTSEEKAAIEVADFGLGDLTHTGLEIVVYVNTERYCAKEMALLPRQTCPEHLHPDYDGQSGKQETFRCRWGAVYLYVPGEQTERPRCTPPIGSAKFYTVHSEVVLKPGQQYTLFPGTLHWFQAGDQGAVISEFSSKSTDEKDVFTDPNIARITRIA